MTADIPARTDADIEALIAATTPGPWTVSTHAMPGADIDDWFVREIAHDPDPRCHPTSVLKVRGARDAADECCWPPSVADADFIAAARELVPSLLARAQKAEADYADLYSRIGDLQASEAELVAAPLRAQRDRAELAAERAKVQAVEALCEKRERELRGALPPSVIDVTRVHMTSGEVRAALASAATPEPSEATPEVCAKPMHKNCGCVRPKGHMGHCNCTYRSAPEGEQP